MVNPRTLIFHISGLSSTPSQHYVLPNWPVDLLIHGQPTDIDLPYQWSVLNPFPLTDQWIFLSMVNPRTLIFHISSLSSTPSLHYVLPTWPVDLLIHGQPTDIDLPYQWSVLDPFPTLRPPHLTSGSSYPWSTHGPIDLPYQWSVLNPLPLTDQWIFLSMVNPHTHWSSILVVCPQPLPTNWPVDPWSIHIPIDLPYQWSVLTPSH